MSTQHTRKWLDQLSPRWMRIVLNFWSPFLCAGIKVKKIADDYRYIEVILKSHWYNQNYVGTHFGGSIFSMTDPFLMLMLIKNFGPKYIVWDKAATIEYKKPGRGMLKAVFTFSEEELQLIRKQADENEKYVFDRAVDVVDEQGEVVASVVKTLYVRVKLSKDNS